MVYLQPLILLIPLSGLSLAFPVESDHSALNRRGPIIDCDIFTSTGNNPQYSMNCTEFDGQDGYPKTIAGGQVDFYHYTDKWDANDPGTIKDVSDVEEALNNVLPSYQSYGAKFDVVVILSTTLVDKQGHNDWEEQAKTGTHTPCFVRIAADASSITETVAHECYHCVQAANRDWPVNVKYNGWWSEAVPEFYTDVFYPIHAKTSFTRGYKYDTPLYQQRAIQLLYSGSFSRDMAGTTAKSTPWFSMNLLLLLFLKLGQSYQHTRISASLSGFCRRLCEQRDQVRRW